MDNITNTNMHMHDSMMMIPPLKFTLIRAWLMSDLPSSELAFCLLAMISSELLIHCLCLPISALNAYLIWATALLHRNLKLLLLLQSLTISAMSLLQLVRLSHKLLHLDVFFDNLLTVLIFFPGYVFCMIFIDWLAFTYLVERWVATLLSSTYEADGHPRIFFIYIIFLALAPCCCYYFLIDIRSETGMVMGANTQYAIYAFTVLSFLCMIAFIALYEFNKRRYALLAASMERPHLSERYQISENIRTTRQLFPAAIFHFVLALLTMTLSLCSYYQVMNSSAAAHGLVVNSVTILFALCCVGIQISVITMHPMLNRKARQLWRTLKVAYLWRSRVVRPWGIESSDGVLEQASVGRNGQSDVPLNLFGNELCSTGSDMDEYFRVLDTMWNKEPEKKKKTGTKQN